MSIQLTTWEFLKFIDPDGPYWLSANASIGKTVTDELDLNVWLLANNSNNIYFTLNHVKVGTRFDSRPTKEHIDAVRFLHVDIDPSPGESPRAIYERLMAYKHTPTCVVFSGGGCQALWAISVVPINSPEDVHFVESRNRQLKVDLGGDSAQDISRILRLPGTTNYPNAKKRARGQKEAKAEVWHLDRMLFYSITDFDPLDVPALRTSTWLVPENKPSGAVKEAIEALPIKLQLELNTEYPKGYRSEPLFACALSLLEYSVSPDVIYWILLDKTLRISDSIYFEEDNSPRNNPENYAARQVLRALQRLQIPEEDSVTEEVPPNVEQFRFLNHHYRKIEHFSNKCRVLRMPTARDEAYAVMSKEDFFNANSHIKYIRFVGKKPLLISTAKEWFDSPTANHYRTAKFAPGVTLPSDIFNFWQGFEYLPKPGNWDLYKLFIYNIICSKDKSAYDYILNWMANAVQKMHLPGETAIVLHGGKGVGKSFFAQMFGPIFGRHYRATRDPFSKFNSFLTETVFLFGDEVDCFKDGAEAKLKLLVTQPHLEIEYKGLERTTFANCLHIVLSTNLDKSIPVSLDERRFFVLKVDAASKQPRSYYDAIEQQMIDGGYSAMLYELLSRDINGWNPQESMPGTKYLAEQKIRNALPIQEWFHTRLSRGFIEGEEWSTRIHKDNLYLDYVNYCHDNSYAYMSRELFHMDFRNMVPGVEQKRESLYKKEGVRGKALIYYLPTLEQCRDNWPIKLGWETEIPQEEA